MEKLRNNITILENIIEEITVLNLASSFNDDTYDKENEMHEKILENLYELQCIHEKKLAKKERYNLKQEVTQC